MRKFFLIPFCSIIIAGCDGQLGPGYRFDLFDSTNNQSLAKAIEREDTKEITAILKKGGVDINLQEPKFGRTLLLLAVGNEKLKSTKALLEAGANVHIRDFDNNDAINEASELYLHDNYSYEILELLIKHGADVNSVRKGVSSDTLNYQVPLCGVVENLKCAKLLLKNGANPYINLKGAYPVWLSLFDEVKKESIFVARYMIVEKKMPVPAIILHDKYGKSLGVYDFLRLDNFPNDSEKKKARQDILNYLKEIKFPENGAYLSN